MFDKFAMQWKTIMIRMTQYGGVVALDYSKLTATNVSTDNPNEEEPHEESKKRNSRMTNLADYHETNLAD